MSELETLILSWALGTYLFTVVAEIAIEKLIPLVAKYKELKAYLDSTYSLRSKKLQMTDRHSTTLKSLSFPSSGFKQKLSTSRSENKLRVLPVEQSGLIEFKRGLGLTLKKIRRSRGLSQTALARRMGTNRFRISRLESGDTSVSIDLLIQALFAAGAKKSDIAKAMNLSTQKSRARPTLILKADQE